MAEQSELKVVISGEDKFTPVVQRFESSIIRSVGAISSAIATLSALAFPVTQAANLEREMANVQKTTNFTANQIANLTKELAKMSLTTDTSAVDLAKIAAAAGQQGLGREGVEGIRQFTESVARMASVLDLTAEDAGRNIGKIINIFQIPLRDIEKTVSAINQVSNNSTARANELINVLKRLGDAGGSLKFTQSLALAATALDLGATPEVAGTTLAKFESAIKVRNKEFATLLGRDRDVLAKQAAEDGFKVFTDVLDELNKLTLKQREAVISKLFGGGRINSLADKQLQDQLKAAPVLQRNLDNAEAGQKSGTSAIREQQTVLATFNKQVEILTNSFKELGRSAGVDLLRPLTGYVAQLRIALQDPGVQSFVGAMVQAFGKFTFTIIETAKFIGNLHVNWENFIRVFEVFAIVKMIDAMKRLASTLPSVSSAFTLLVGSSKAAVTADANGVVQQVSAWGAIKAAVNQARDSLKGYSAARKEAAVVDANVAATEKAALDAAAKERQLRRDADTKALQAKVATNNLGNAEQAVVQATRKVDNTAVNAAALGQQGVINAQRVSHQKLEAAELFHQKRLADIQTEFAGSRTVIEKSMRDTILNEENAFYAKQIAGITTQNAKRIAEAEANATRLVAITTLQAREELAVLEAQAAQQRALAGKATGAAAAAAASLGAAQGQTSAAGAAASAAKVASNEQAGQVSRLSALLKGLAGAFALVGTALSFVVKALVPVTFWFTVLFSIADALGLLDNLGEKFNKLTDAIGLTSEAARKKAEQDKKLHETHLQQQKDLDDLIDRYRKLKDATTGVLKVGEVEQITTDFKSARTSQDFQNAATRFAERISGQQEDQKRAEQSLAKLPEEQKKVVDEISKQQARLAQVQDAIAQNIAKFGAEGAARVTQQLQKTKVTLEQSIKELQDKAKRIGPDMSEAIKSTLPNVKKDAESVNTIFKSLFTQESANTLSEFGGDILKLKKELEKLDNDREEAIKVRDAKRGSKDEKAAQVALDSLDRQIEDQKVLIEGKMNVIRENLKKIANDPSVSEATKATTLGVLSLLALDTKILETFLSKLDDVKKQSIAFTGTGVDPKVLGQPTTPGTKTTQLAGVDDENRKRIKALADFEKAQATARVELQKEKNKELLDENQHMYDRGLQSLEQFYANKHALDEANLENEISLVQQEIAIKEKERRQSDLRQSDRIRIDAEIVTLKGKKGVLEAQVADLPRQIGNQTEDSLKQFQETVLQSQIEMMDVFGVTDFHVKFEAELKLAESQLKDTIAKMRQSIGQNGVTKELIDQLELQLTAKAVEKTFSAIADKTKLATADLDRYISRIALLNQQGKLTDIDAETLTNRARARIAEQVKKEINDMTKELDELRKKGETIATSDAYKKLAEQIEVAKDRFIELRQAADATARVINSAVESSLSDAFKQLSNGDKKTQQQLLDEAKRLKDARQPGYKTQQDVFVVENMKTGVQKALDTFSTGITSSIREVLAKDLSQTIIKAFGGGGTGGIGGLISSILHPGEQQAREKETIGLTEANAMYVELTQTSKDAIKPIPPIEPGLNPNDPFANRTVKGITVNEDGTDDSAKNDIKQKGQLLLSDVTTTAGKILTTVGGLMGGKTGGALFVFGTFFSKFKKIFTDETTSLTKELDGGGLGLGELFKSLGSGISKLFESITSMFGGGGDSGFLSMFASFFHDGGMVGEGGSDMRMFPASVFQNAARYHNGGPIGLRPDEVPAILQTGEMVLSRGQLGAIAGGGSAPLHPAASAAPQAVQLSIHPDAINMTLRQWLENEMARIHANR